MTKTVKILIISIVIIAIVAVIAGVIILQNNKTKLDPINSSEDLTKLIEKVYEGQEDKIPGVMTQTIDTTDENVVNMITGLTNGEKLEYLAVSEPMISSQAYSFILAKVKKGVNANEIAKEMFDRVDTAKWICVYAEKVYATNSGDVVCLIMSSEEWAKPIYENFKKVAGKVGEEYERTEEDPVPKDINGIDGIEGNDATEENNTLDEINALEGIE